MGSKNQPSNSYLSLFAPETRKSQYNLAVITPGAETAIE
jgi:hypothetical protein